MSVHFFAKFQKVLGRTGIVNSIDSVVKATKIVSVHDINLEDLAISSCCFVWMPFHDLQC